MAGDRQQLLVDLAEAAQVEHALICIYLYAMFSIPDSGTNDRENRLLLNWRKTLRMIAHDEMRHLATVTNISTLVGGGTRIRRPSFPYQLRYAPASQGGQWPIMKSGFLDQIKNAKLARWLFGNGEGDNKKAERQFSLRPFGPKMLAWAIGVEGGNQTSGLVLENFTPVLTLYERIGKLYNNIEEGLNALAGEEMNTVSGSGPPDLWPGTIVVPRIKEVGEAIEAVKDIRAQSEGGTAQGVSSHVMLLQQMQAELANEDANAATSGTTRIVYARNVVTNPSTEEGRSGAALLTEGLAVEVCDLFNELYHHLIWIFEQYFANSTETDQQRQALRDISVSLMKNVISPLGYLLTTLPAGSVSNEFAGPSFELKGEDLLGHSQELSWAIIVKQFDTIVPKIFDLLKKVGEGNGTYTTLDLVRKAVILIRNQLALYQKPQAPTTDFVRNNAVPLLQFEFSGWFQCRLGTDPDPARSGRGESGWTFALPGEPDLDGVIRFQAPVTPRVPGFKVGVMLDCVRKGDPTNPVEKFGCRTIAVSLDSRDSRGPFFEPPNSGQEAFDPAILSFSCNGQPLFVVEDKDLMWDERIEQQRRFRVNQDAFVNKDFDVQALASLTKEDEGLLRSECRSALLKRAIADAADPKVKEMLRIRIANYEAINEEIRSKAMLMLAEYRFPLRKGVTHWDAEKMGLQPEVGSVWILNLFFGKWDPDTLMGYANGSLSVYKPEDQATSDPLG